MTGLAAILASLLSLAVAIPLAMGAEYLSSASEVTQVLAIILAVAAYIAIWWGSFNLICNIMRVPG